MEGGGSDVLGGRSERGGSDVKQVSYVKGRASDLTGGTNT